MYPVCSEFIAVIFRQWKRQLGLVWNHFDLKFMLNDNAFTTFSLFKPFFISLHYDHNYLFLYSDHYYVLFSIGAESLLKSDRHLSSDTTSSWRKTIFMNSWNTHTAQVRWSWTIILQRRMTLLVAKLFIQMCSSISCLTWRGKKTKGLNSSSAIFLHV